jgi:hypothetical protein
MTVSSKRSPAPVRAAHGPADTVMLTDVPSARPPPSSRPPGRSGARQAEEFLATLPAIAEVIGDQPVYGYTDHVAVAPRPPDGVTCAGCGAKIEPRRYTPARGWTGWWTEAPQGNPRARIDNRCPAPGVRPPAGASRRAGRADPMIATAMDAARPLTIIHAMRAWTLRPISPSCVRLRSTARLGLLTATRRAARRRPAGACPGHACQRCRSGVPGLNYLTGNRG